MVENQLHIQELEILFFLNKNIQCGFFLENLKDNFKFPLHFNYQIMFQEVSDYKENNMA